MESGTFSAVYCLKFELTFDCFLSFRFYFIQFWTFLTLLFLLAAMGKCIQESQKFLRNATLQRIFPEDTSNILVFQSGFMVELMKDRGKIGAVSLLVHLSPATGEPVAMNVNNRRTQLTSLKSTVYISNPGTKEKVAFNFTDELRQDRIKDCSSVIGDKSIHYFMSGVESRLFAEEDFQGVTDYANLLQ